MTKPTFSENLNSSSAPAVDAAATPAATPAAATPAADAAATPAAATPAADAAANPAPAATPAAESKSVYSRVCDSLKNLKDYSIAHPYRVLGGVALACLAIYAIRNPKVCTDNMAALYNGALDKGSQLFSRG